MNNEMPSWRLEALWAFANYWVAEKNMSKLWERSLIWPMVNYGWRSPTLERPPNESAGGKYLVGRHFVSTQSLAGCDYSVERRMI
jgi:hypothetical protein